MSDSEGGKKKKDQPEVPEATVVVSDREAPPELGRITHVVVDGVGYERGEPVDWPKVNLSKGRTSGAVVEDLLLVRHTVLVKLRAVDPRYNGQVAWISRHSAGCRICYEGPIPEQPPADVVVEPGKIMPRSLANERAQEEAAPVNPAVEQELVLIQETLGRVEAVINKKVLPQPDEVAILKRGLENQYLDPERKGKIRKFMLWIEARKLRDQEIMEKRKRAETAVQ